MIGGEALAAAVAPQFINKSKSNEGASILAPSKDFVSNNEQFDIYCPS
jgi:hypothetical protein